MRHHLHRDNLRGRPLRDGLGNDRWVVPLIHGFFQQRTLAVFGQTLTIALIARRSRHFAGTRYQKRGVNNEVSVVTKLAEHRTWLLSCCWACSHAC